MNYGKARKIVKVMEEKFGCRVPGVVIRLKREMIRCDEVGCLTDDMVTFCNIVENTLIENGRVVMNDVKADILNLTIIGKK